MIFTTNKPLSEWGKVLHDEDLAAAILDRVLERGLLIDLDGPSARTRHLKLEEVLPPRPERLRISGINGSEFLEPTGWTKACTIRGAVRKHNLEQLTPCYCILAKVVQQNSIHCPINFELLSVQTTPTLKYSQDFSSV
jgi:IstB-like ATP binding protein